MNYDFWNNLRYCPVCPKGPLLYADGSCPRCKYPNHERKEGDTIPRSHTFEQSVVKMSAFDGGRKPTVAESLKAEIDNIIADREEEKIERIAKSIQQTEIEGKGITRDLEEIKNEVRAILPK